MDREKYLDIDFLKKNNKRLYYFGLGFIQLVISENERIHFYNTTLKNKQTNDSDEIHNHRYNFKSSIIKGVLSESKYKIVEGNTHLLKNESCGKDIITPIVDEIVGIKLIEHNNHKDNYYSWFNELHKVNFYENTITFVEKGKIINNYAQVLYPVNKDIVCPFSINLSETELWELIEDTIKK